LGICQQAENGDRGAAADWDCGEGKSRTVEFQVSSFEFPAPQTVVFCISSHGDSQQPSWIPVILAICDTCQHQGWEILVNPAFISDVNRNKPPLHFSAPGMKR
jgi:hypothetical protein